jgi:DNA-binding NarL/FixJ family response regulator
MRILIADSDPRVRRALQMLLEQEPELTVSESAGLNSLAAQARVFKPDLLLLDWELPGRPAAALLLALGALDVRPRVIALSRRPEAESAALAAGADAFVSKADPPERLLTTLRGFIRKPPEPTD